MQHVAQGPIGGWSGRSQHVYRVLQRLGMRLWSRRRPMRGSSACLGVAWTYHREYQLQGPSRLVTAASPETLGLRLVAKERSSCLLLPTSILHRHQTRLIAMSCPRCKKGRGLRRPEASQPQYGMSSMAKFNQHLVTSRLPKRRASRKQRSRKYAAVVLQVGRWKICM